jgi:hypothetical protein
MTDPKSRREPSTETDSGLFADFDLEDYVENRPLIRALRSSEVNAHVVIARLTREQVSSRNELDKTRRDLVELRISHEHGTGEYRTEIARLEEALKSSRSQLAEQVRQSTVAVIVAWVGSVLVGFGVNLVTDGQESGLGIGILLAGALVEGAAFFIPRKAAEPASTTAGQVRP